ncbi:MAG: sulfide/dihydroorotate dehydrogenase-like FAD/NAD-binding protein [Planctomycetota bacterium]|nr:sulfide/dihydroorotate dehydrogenase-like FAD/NAD-binding protein [Planctomycetota bacterium]MDI6788349.1 sulfide/dihydroorotate dehydrogenase-like FAD/NAD-binding protein [Planctomycetota bacterium]
MFKIVNKSILGKEETGIYRIVIDAPRIARTRHAGQFVVLRTNEQGERIPLTICDADPVAGTFTLVFQAVGKSTMQLGKMNVGDNIQDVLGPLGRPTHIENYGTVVCIGGGIGIAPVHPIAQAMKQAGNKVISIIGARSKDLLILEEEMRRASNELLVTTDDGSYVRKGFTSDVLKEVINRPEKIDLVVAIGPVPMMRVISDITRSYGIKTMVSLNPIMLDATGMCGVCRVTVGGKTQFACVDGPEFDGHLVDFGELQKRLTTYLKDEKIAVEKYKHNPSCVDLAIAAQNQTK